MDRTDVVIMVLAVLTVVVALWTKPLKYSPFWLTIVLSAASYPLGAVLLSALESAGGRSSTWAEWTFLITVALVVVTLVQLAVRRLGYSGNTRVSRMP